MTVVVPLALALAFLGLSRWGKRNATAFAAGNPDEVRRAREEHQLVRGARSCLVLSLVCGALAAAQAVMLVLEQ